VLKAVGNDVVRVSVKQAQPAALMSAKEARRFLRRHPEQCALALLQQVGSPGDVLASAGVVGPDGGEDVGNGDVPASVRAVLDDFADVLSPPPGGLPPSRPVEHTIVLEPDTRPIFKKGWRLSPLELEEARKQIAELLDKGWIRMSRSPWSAPILFVKKKNGQLRMCVDYRALNDATVKDRGPLPRISELLDQLSGSKVFSKIDLASGYHQVRVEESSVEKTAFTCTVGHFEWLVMPFGLTSAPATFQRLMNVVLADLLGKGVVVYLDDILVHAATQQEHDRLLREVFSRLREYKLYTQVPKCSFSKPELNFLGHIVSGAGIAADPALVATIKEWPKPGNMRDLRAFLGTCNFYRKFVPNYSQIVSPLTDLTRGERMGRWGSAQQHAFEEVKHLLCNPPVLAAPDFSGRFQMVLTTDASAFAVGAVLEQEQPDGSVRPVAYHSRKLRGAELNYSAYDREALGVVDALEVWRPYLEGLPFLLRTDHEALKYLQTQQSLSRRQARWVERLQSYSFTIEHLPGKKNRADALSRRPDYELESSPAVTAELNNSQLSSEYDESLLRDLRLGYCKDERFRLGDIPAGMQLDAHGLYRQEGRIVVPDVDAVKEQIMRRLHDDAVSGHFGADRQDVCCSQGAFCMAWDAKGHGRVCNYLPCVSAQ